MMRVGKKKGFNLREGRKCDGFDYLCIKEM